MDKDHCLSIFRDNIHQTLWHISQQRNGPGLCVCVTWNAELNLCQPVLSQAWGKTWLYQKSVMETRDCDWWRYHLPSGWSSIHSLINDLMCVVFFASTRKWHESRSDSGCNTRQIKWLQIFTSTTNKCKLSQCAFMFRRFWRVVNIYWNKA